MKLLNLLTILAVFTAIYAEKTNPFKKVIVLVFENHSFDNLLGFMDSPIGTLNEKVNCNTASGKEYCQSKGCAFSTRPDPGHGFYDQNQQIYGEKFIPGDEQSEAPMDGFASNYKTHLGNAQNVFDSYEPEQVPILSTLAKEYMTYTRWFSSVPSFTIPNKLFVHAASSGGNLLNDNHYFYTFGYPAQLQTIQNQLQDEGHSWKVHWMDWNELFSISPINEETDNFVQDYGFDLFYKNLEEGTLPEYTYLIPSDYNSKDGPANDYHPPQDVRNGEQILKEVYEKFRASQYWEDTLFFVTFDEHGGFYDHISPPTGVANPNPDMKPTFSFDFERLGVRVPAIAISPWIKQGTDETKLEHSSIPKTLHEIFNLKAGYLNNREAESNVFIHDDVLVDEMRTDCPEKLPEVPFDKDYLYPEPEDVPAPELTKGKTFYVQQLGSMLVNKGALNMLKFEQIFKSIQNDDQAMQFAFEAQVILGYRSIEKIDGFVYLNQQMMQQQE